MEKIISPAGVGTERQARLRLQELARSKGSSLAELSKILGRNAAYLQQYVARGSPRHLDAPDLRRIAEYLGIETDLIATRSCEPLLQSIPRLAIGASAGPGRVAVSEESYDRLYFSDRWLLENGLKGADLSSIRVEGDSMEPLLRNGDEIIVDRNRRGGEGVFVVRIGDILHVKKIRASAPETVVLISENPAYPPLELPRVEVDVIGRVVWKGGRV